MTTPTQSQNDLGKSVSQLETTLDLYLVQKAPALPVGIKESLVKYGPYVDLIMILMSAPLVLAVLGLGAVLAPFSVFGGVRSVFSFSFSYIFLIAMVALQVMALPGLFKRSASAWKLLYYSALVDIIYTVFSFNLGSLISIAITLYFLFQIKSYYK